MSESLESLADRIRRHPKLVIADDFEIALEKVSSRESRFHNGTLHSQSEGDRLWVGLRILHRKRGGRAHLLNPHPDFIASLVDSAFESANRSTVDPWFRFAIWKTLKPASPSVDEEVFSPDSLYSRLPVKDPTLDESYEEQFVQTHLKRKTEKVEFKHQRRMHFASFRLDSIEETHGCLGSLKKRDAWMEGMLQTLDGRTKGTKPCGRGKRKLILAPRVAVRILRLMAPWFFADAAQAGRSPLADRQGESFFPACLTLCDDGNHPESPWAVPFDMEGVPTQRTILIDKGILKSWLHDTYSATRENRLSTGNFLKEEGGMQPRIGASTLFWDAGELSRQALLEQMGSGVLMDTLETLSPIGGDRQSFIARGSGWRVAVGQLSEPISDIEFEFDPLLLMQRAGGVANDLTFFSGCGSPSILLEEMPLGI